MLVQAGAQHAHAFFAILDLRFFVLAADHGVGRQVRDAHGGVGRVDRLAARTGGTERIDAQVLGFDLDVHFFGFRQHRHRDGGSVHAALLFRSPARAARDARRSHTSAANTRRLPSMMAMTSFSPPTPDSEVESTSTFQRCVSA